MNLSFHIQPLNINTFHADLYVVISAQGVSYIILDNNICRALVIYNFPAGTSDETAASYIHRIMNENPVLQNTFRKVNVIYGYSPSALVPNEFIDEKDMVGVLELVFGADTQRVIKMNEVHGHPMSNVYGIPKVIEKEILRYFEFAKEMHLFSLLPLAGNSMENDLYCIFGSGQILVTFFKGGKLQVIQNYSFKIPEDVAYHLLTICKGFEVSVNDIKLWLSGMIDESSVLFSTLNKYFRHIQFEALPDQFQYPEDIKQYPSHYFSHLFAVAACV